MVIFGLKKFHSLIIKKRLWNLNKSYLHIVKNANITKRYAVKNKLSSHPTLPVPLSLFSSEATTTNFLLVLYRNTLYIIKYYLYDSLLTKPSRQYYVHLLLAIMFYF